jgi:formylglycine-generating enzyme required for sulfatase activity
VPKILTVFSKRTAQYFIEDLGDGILLEMVQIPAGSFKMGSPEGEGFGSERPQHNVTVKQFFLGRYQVTQEQWARVATLPKEIDDIQPDPSSFKGKRLPIERVSWYDVKEFCARLSKKTGGEYRLPSEAEWEYACRAGTTTPFHFGSTITTELANYDGNSVYRDGKKGEYRKKTTEVGVFPPNPFGLYDMHGNVWEWCQDQYHNSYDGAPEDGSAWLDENNSQSRMLRGGSWNGDPEYCRSAIRDINDAGVRNFNVGFRVVCSGART